MKTKLKTVVLGALVAAPLVLAAGPVFARDDWHGRRDNWTWRNNDRGRAGWNWRNNDRGRADRWRDVRNDRRDIRHDYGELARARRQRDDLVRSGASRGRIAQEDDHIRSIWDDIRGDRRDTSRDRRGWNDHEFDRD